MNLIVYLACMFIFCTIYYCNKFWCLFDVDRQPSYLYEDVPGGESVSDILSLEFTSIDDNMNYNAQTIINDILLNSTQITNEMTDKLLNISFV